MEAQPPTAPLSSPSHRISGPKPQEQPLRPKPRNLPKSQPQRPSRITQGLSIHTALLHARPLLKLRFPPPLPSPCPYSPTSLCPATLHPHPHILPPPHA
eukprot:685568-Rhodomonas_salina.1